MSRVLIEANSVREFHSKQSGQIFRKQSGGFKKPGSEISERFEFFLDDKQQPYAPGEYLVAGDSLYVSHKGRDPVLAVGVRLVPFVASPAAAVK